MTHRATALQHTQVGALSPRHTYDSADLDRQTWRHTLAFIQALLSVACAHPPRPHGDTLAHTQT